MSTITIIKQATPQDGQDFTFLGPEQGAEFMLDDDQDPTLPNERTFVVPPGGYSVREVVPDGWMLVRLDCTNSSIPGIPIITINDIDDVPWAALFVEAGDEVVCTFVNREKEPEISLLPLEFMMMLMCKTRSKNQAKAIKETTEVLQS